MIDQTEALKAVISAQAKRISDIEVAVRDTMRLVIQDQEELKLFRTGQRVVLSADDMAKLLAV